MAEGLVFHYRDADTPVHRIDPRIKLLFLLVQSFAMVFYSFQALIIPGVLSLLLMIIIRIPLTSYARELRVFLFLGGIIFLGRFLSAGADEAGVLTLRFFIIVSLGLVLMDTTAADDAAAAAAWYVGHLSPKLAGILAARLLLTLAFIPMIFDSIREVKDARSARGDSPRRYPLGYTVSFLLQIFEILLVKAEEISLALEARGFTGSMPQRVFKAGFIDLLALLIGCCAVIAGIILS